MKHWFVAVKSTEVPRGPIRAFLFDQPVVIARLPNRELVALADYCPHQGLPLSDGDVADEGIVCRYHGWTFDGQGRCLNLQRRFAGSADADDNRAAAYQVREIDGLIWISPRRESPFPPRALAASGHKDRMLGEALWECGIAEAQARAFDAPWISGASVQTMHEAQFAHPKEFSTAFGSAGDKGRFPWSPVLKRAYFSELSLVEFEYGLFGRTVWLTVYFTPETPTTTRLRLRLHYAARHSLLARWMRLNRRALERYTRAHLEQAGQAPGDVQLSNYEVMKSAIGRAWRDS